MPDGVRRRIFEPFFTTKTGDAHSGSGVGLSTVRRIVAGYGGGVRVETRQGGGTTFEAWLPVAERGGRALPEVARPGATGRPDSRVLVVEGDPELRRVTVRALGEDGHTVVAVDSATEALRVFGRSGRPFDLAVVDEVLPDRRGRELVAALVRRMPGLSIVLVSGRPGAGSDPRGGDAVELPTPFTPDELRSAVSRALGGDGPPRSYQPSAVR